MTIQIDTALIHKSIAQVLATIDSNATIFDNPNQQGTKLPAWFILHREPVKIEREIQRRWLVYSIDVLYMLDLNKPRMMDDYTSIAESLDYALDYLKIYDSDVLIHVYDREWEAAMNAMKYSFTLRLRVSKETQKPPYMQVIEDLQVFLKEQLKIVRVRFVNPRKEFTVDMPQEIYTHTGNRITLPTIDGIFIDADDNEWLPDRWSIGGFGCNIEVTDNMTAELIFAEVPKPNDDEETDDNSDGDES